MHKQKKRRGGEKDQTGRYDTSRHGPGMTSTFHFLYRTERGLLTARQPYIIDIDIQLATVGHSAFRLGLGDGGESQTFLWNYEDSIDTHVFEDFEVDGVANMRIARRD